MRDFSSVLRQQSVELLSWAEMEGRRELEYSTFGLQIHWNVESIAFLLNGDPGVSLSMELSKPKIEWGSI